MLIAPIQALPGAMASHQFKEALTEAFLVQFFKNFLEIFLHMRLLKIISFAIIKTIQAAISNVPL